MEGGQRPATISSGRESPRSCRVSPMLAPPSAPRPAVAHLPGGIPHPKIVSDQPCAPGPEEA